LATSGGCRGVSGTKRIGRVIRTSCTSLTPGCPRWLRFLFDSFSSPSLAAVRHRQSPSLASHFPRWLAVVVFASPSLAPVCSLWPPLAVAALAVVGFIFLSLAELVVVGIGLWLGLLCVQGFLRRRRLDMVRYAGTGWRDGQLDGINEGMKKRTTPFIVVRLSDILHGPPIAWVPPGVSPSLIPPSSELEPPTSLWKGEGRMQRVQVAE